MPDTTNEALQGLAGRDLFQLRLTGMILAAIVERGILSAPEARAIVGDVLDQVPLEMDDYRLAMSQLYDEFRG
jgi:hypothetical protein